MQMAKDIKNYEGLYSYTGTTIFQITDNDEVILKPTLCDGELVIRLCKNNICKTHKVKNIIK
jgi:hypothetical protein